MEIGKRHRRKVQGCSGCMLGLAAHLHSKAPDETCEALREAHLDHCLGEVSAFLSTCATAPSTALERTWFLSALAFRAGGFNKAYARQILGKVRCRLVDPEPSERVLQQIINRVFRRDCPEWRELRQLHQRPPAPTAQRDAR